MAAAPTEGMAHRGAHNLKIASYDLDWWAEIEPMDHHYTDEIVCPHCGYAFRDSWEFPDSARINCDSCDREFLAERDTTVTYSTAPIPEDPSHE